MYQEEVQKKISRYATILVVLVGIAFLLIPLVRTSRAASAPNIISYQGRLLDSNSNPVGDSSLNMEFRLYTALTGGTCLWSNDSADCSSTATQAVTLTTGLFSENLGDTGASYPAIADTVFADNATVFLEVWIGTEQLTPRKQIVSAPYALNSDTLDGLDSTDLQLFEAGSNGTYEDDAAVIIGTDQAETLTNSGFSLAGNNDLFVGDMLGVEGSVYTDGSFVAGDATTYADDSITQGTAGDSITIDVASGDAAGEDFIVTANNIGLLATGALSITPDAALTTGIDLTDTDLTNAISVAANTILGTTGTIDYTNFDVAASGAITVAAGTGIDANASGVLDIGDDTATTVNVGTTAATTLNLGASGSLTRAINIGTGTGADTIAIGTGGTGADDIDIGDSVAVLDLASADLGITLSATSADGLDLTSVNTTGDAIDLDANSLTSGNVFNISATSLTSGDVLNLTRSAVANNGGFISMNDGTDDVIIFSYSGSPNGALSAPRGSISLDYTNGRVYVNTDDGTTWSQLSAGAGAGNTLDEAYDEGGAGSGRVITVDSSAIEMTGSNAADYTLEVTTSAAGGVLYINDTDGTGYALHVDTGEVLIDEILNVDGSVDFDGTTFDVDGSGLVSLSSTGAAVTLDAVTQLSIDVSAATAASNISVVTDADAEDLTIETTGTDGDLLINSADDIVITATDQFQVIGSNGAVTAIHLDGNNAAGDGITIDANTGGVDVNMTGPFNIDGGLLDIGTCSAEVANGDNDACITGVLEVDGETELDGTLDADGAADFSGGLTNSASELLVSGGNMQINDNLLLTFGSDDDISLGYDETTDDAFEMIGALVSIGDDPGGALATGAGDLIVSGDLEVDGSARFDGGIYIEGTTNTYFVIDSDSTGVSDVDVELWFSDDGNNDAHQLIFDDGADEFQFIDDAASLENVRANAFYAGAASTTYGDGAITQSDAGETITINVADGDAAGEDLIITADNIGLLATGALSITPNAALTTAIDLTDTDLTNALSLADNNIIGTAYTVQATTGVLTLDGATDLQLTATADDILMNPADDLTLTLVAAGQMVIDAGTDRAIDVLTMDVDVNSANVDGMFIDLDIGTALSSGETATAYHADLAGLAGDDGDSDIAGFYVTGDTTSGARVSGLKTTGALHYGIDFGPADIETADIRFENNELVDNDTDDVILFSGTGGTNDAYLAIDLDGGTTASPTIYDASGNYVFINDNLGVGVDGNGNHSIANISFGYDGNDLYVEDELGVDGEAYFDYSVDVELAEGQQMTISDDGTATADLVAITAATSVAGIDALNISYTAVDDDASDTLYGIDVGLVIQNDTTADDVVYGQRIDITNNDGGVTGSTSGLYVSANDSGSAAVSNGILIENLQSTDIDLSNGILIRATTADSIATAINVSDAEITNAMSVGANNIIGTAYTVQATTGVLTLDGATDLQLTATADDILMDPADDFTLTLAADGQAVIDAASTDTTTTGGVLDIDVDTITANNTGINLDYQVGDAAASNNYYANSLNITVDDDAGQSALVSGYYLNATNNDGGANIYGVHIADLGGTTGDDTFAYYQVGSNWDFSMYTEAPVMHRILTGDSGSSNMTVVNRDSTLTAQQYLLDLQYFDDGDTNGDYMILRDNTGGDTKLLIAEEGFTSWTPGAAGDALTITLPAADTQAIVINSTTADSTNTSGLIDLDMDTVADNQYGIHLTSNVTGEAGTTPLYIDVNNDGTDLGELLYGQYINIDDDSTGTDDIVHGLYINYESTSQHADSSAFYVNQPNAGSNLSYGMYMSGTILTGIDMWNISVAANNDAIRIADDNEIVLGNGSDITIEYDENGTDQLRITGATIFASAVEFAAAIDSDSVDVTPDSNIDAVDITGTNMTSASAIDMDMLNTSGQVINLAWSGATSAAGQLEGALLDFGNVSSNSNIVYGLHVNDLGTGDGAAAQYAIYQSGTTWDYGLYTEGSIYHVGTAGSTVWNINAGDATITDGSLRITDADNAATSFLVLNNTATTTGAGAAGGVAQIDSASLTTGTLFDLQLTEGTLNGGAYIRAWDATGSEQVFAVKEDGEVEIKGSAELTPALTIDDGDLTVTDGRLMIGASSLTEFNYDYSGYAKFNSSSTDTDLVQIVISADGDGADALAIDYEATDNNGNSAINIDFDNNVSVAAADTVYGIYMNVDNDEALDSVYGLYIQNDTAATSAPDALIYLANDDGTVAVDNGIDFKNPGAAGMIVDAVDASAANITNALNVGTNTIIGTTGVIDFTDFDVSADGLVTLAPDGAGSTISMTLPSDNTQGLVIDAATADNQSTAGLVLVTADMEADNSNTSGISIDYEILEEDSAGNNANTHVALDILATMTSNDGDNLYGIQVADLSGSAAAGNEYAIFQDGEAWDAGLYIEDVAEFQDATRATPGIANAGGDVFIHDQLEIDGSDDGTGADVVNIDLTGKTGGSALEILLNDTASNYTGDALLYVSQANNNAGSTGNVAQLVNVAGSGNADTLQIDDSSEARSIFITRNGFAGGDIDATGDEAIYIDWEDTEAADQVFAIESDNVTDTAADTVKFKITAQGAVYSDANVYGTPADFAEYFYDTTGDLVAGEVVAIDQTYTEGIRRSNGVLDQDVMGVVSTKAAFVSNWSEEKENNSNWKVIALAGQVPVRVSGENGPIAIGDYLTSASLPGYAMKATEAGQVIGRALQAYSGPGTDVIVAYISGEYYTGTVIGSDGTDTIVSDTLVLDSLSTANELTPAVDSQDLVLRGSAWDGAQALDQDMRMATVVDGESDYRLSITDTMETEVAYVTNEGILYVAGDIITAGHLYPSDRGTLQTEKYIYYDGSSGPGGDMMRTNASGWSTGSYDFAEMFPSTETLEPGDVVVFATDSEHVRQSTEEYDEMVAGIVSTKPGFLAGENSPGEYPIALAGRVPVKVSLENGAIEVGDPLTTSSTPGYAMRATESGPIVGNALQPFDSSNEDDKIIAFVNVSYFDDGVIDTMPGTQNTASNFGGGDFSSLSLGGNLYMQANNIIGVNDISGIGDNWVITAAGDVEVKGSLKTIIESYQGEDIETVAQLSLEHTVTLSGTAKLSAGLANINFEDIDPSFNDIISTLAPVRVMAMPVGEPVMLYVTNQDEDGFTISSDRSSEAEFNWFVTAYRKDYEPEEYLEVEVVEELEEVEVEEGNDAGNGVTEEVVEESPTEEVVEEDLGEELTEEVEVVEEDLETDGETVANEDDMPTAGRDSEESQVSDPQTE